MLEKLQAVEDRYEELSNLLSDPEVIADNSRYQQYAKAHAEITPIVDKYKEYKKVLQSISEAEAMLKEDLEDDFREMVQAELTELKPQVEVLTKELEILLLPKDPNDEKNVIMEIRAGTGGEEAGLFAGDLYRMYCKYAESKGWKMEVMDSNMTDIGGFKEIIFVIEGNSVYSTLKYESGVHRVQRIPSTESGGRIHTSAATVAVMPEAEEVEVEINQNDIRIDVFRSSGAGGQHVNKTDSAIRITHLPTNIVVTCQNERSQHQNKDMAMKILKARLTELAEQEHKENLKELKGDYSMNTWGSQIRSYVFQPYTMVKDHRTGAETANVQAVMDGDIDYFINEKLKFKEE